MNTDPLENANNSSLGLRELQRLAKDTEDTLVQMEVANRGSLAALKNLARNPKAVTSALMTAYFRTEDLKLKREIALNLNSDVEKLTPSDRALAVEDAYQAKKSYKPKLRQLRSRYEARYESIVHADWIDDETVEAFEARLSPQASGKTIYMTLMIEIVSNKNNQLSKDKLIELTQEYSILGNLVFQAGRIPVSQLKYLTPNSVHLGGVKDAELLTVGAQLVASGHWNRASKDHWGKPDFYGDSARNIARSIADNPNSPQSALRELVGKDSLVDQRKLYNHSNISADLKKILAKESSTIKSQLRIEKACGTRTVGELRQELTLDGEVINTARGYHKTDLQLDRKKIIDYGLEKADVETIMGEENLPFYRYNPETGHYGGSFDTSG